MGTGWVMGTLASLTVLPDELMAEIFSWLSVKHVMQLRCVNKFFKTLISDPYFVQMHLEKSTPTPNLALVWLVCRKDSDSHFLSQSIPGLLQNQFNSLRNDPSYRLINFCIPFFSRCMALFLEPSYENNNKFGLFSRAVEFKFCFGYDNLNKTYKMVAFLVDLDIDRCLENTVKIFSLGDNSWRDIQCFPVDVIPLHWIDVWHNKDVYLNGTINWLAYSNYDFYLMGVIENYAILSLDLSTESYTQMTLPRGFDKGPHVRANIALLMNFLCFCRDLERNHFVIWQMKEFGVQESWIQLFKISYHNFYSTSNLFDIQKAELLPIHLSENGYTLILTNEYKAPVFICDCRDDTVELIRTTDTILWLWAKDHIESLVPTC
ncbi:F-box/kelch-repeat protein At3g23880-like [Lathyrus oleraceus]|uniref:F-box/kelch-repeat protein At3g23880-like n=1 Tax=Pisum sativum TaxID=3888 RepID=UPI0021D21C17|nr:F-box/kelch-repeat protein At3g23880-like [Pisum sativum]